MKLFNVNCFLRIFKIKQIYLFLTSIVNNLIKKVKKSVTVNK